MARAPNDTATSMAARPTPPPAPSTSTTSPSDTPARRPRANRAVQYDWVKAAARAASSSSGRRLAWAAPHTTWLA